MPEGLDPYQSAGIPGMDFGPSVSTAIADAVRSASQMAVSNPLSGVVMSGGAASAAAPAPAVTSLTQNVVSAVQAVPAAMQTTATYATEALTSAYRDVASTAAVTASATRDMASRLMSVRNVLTPPLSYVPPQFAPQIEPTKNMGFIESLRVSQGLYFNKPRGMLKSEYEDQAKQNLRSRMGAVGQEAAFGVADLASWQAPFTMAAAGFAVGGPVGAVAGFGIGAIGTAAGAMGIDHMRNVYGQRKEVGDMLRTTSWRYMKGRRLTEDQIGSTSREIVDATRGIEGLNIGQTGKMFAAATEMGTFDIAKNEDDVVKRYKAIAKKAVKLSETIEVSLDEAIQRIASKNPSLINPDYYGAVGAAAGLTAGEINRAGQNSSAMFRGTGLSQQFTYNLGAQALGAARNLQTRDAAGRDFVEGVGGLAEAQNQILQSQNKFMQSPSMPMILGAFANNKGELDPARMNKYLSGSGGFEQLSGMFTQNLQSNAGNIAWQPMLNMNMQKNMSAIPPELLSSLQVKYMADQAQTAFGSDWKNMSPEGRKAMVVNMAPQFGMDTQQARLMVESIDPEATQRSMDLLVQKSNKRLQIMTENKEAWFGEKGRISTFFGGMKKRGGKALSGAVSTTVDTAGEYGGVVYKGITSKIERAGDEISSAASKGWMGPLSPFYDFIGGAISEGAYYLGGSDEPVDLSKTAFSFSSRTSELAREFRSRGGSAVRLAMEGDARSIYNDAVNDLVTEDRKGDGRGFSIAGIRGSRIHMGLAKSGRAYELHKSTGGFTRKESREIAEQQYKSGEYRVSENIMTDYRRVGEEMRPTGYLETGETKRAIALKYGKALDSKYKLGVTDEERTAIRESVAKRAMSTSSFARNMKNVDIDSLGEKSAVGKMTNAEYILQTMELGYQETLKKLGPGSTLSQEQYIQTYTDEFDTVDKDNSNLIRAGLKLRDPVSMHDAGIRVDESKKSLASVLSDESKIGVKLSKTEQQEYIENAFEIEEAIKMQGSGEWKVIQAGGKKMANLENRLSPNVLRAGTNTLAGDSNLKTAILTDVNTIATDNENKRFKNSIAGINIEALGKSDVIFKNTAALGEKYKPIIKTIQRVLGGEGSRSLLEKTLGKKGLETAKELMGTLENYGIEGEAGGALRGVLGEMFKTGGGADATAGVSDEVINSEAGQKVLSDLGKALLVFSAAMEVQTQLNNKLLGK